MEDPDPHAIALSPSSHLAHFSQTTLLLQDMELRCHIHGRHACTPTEVVSEEVHPIKLVSDVERPPPPQENRVTPPSPTALPTHKITSRLTSTQPLCAVQCLVLSQSIWSHQP